MHYPQIDPIILSLGPVALRWYGLMYLLGFTAVWWLGHRRATTQQPHWSRDELSDMVFFGALGAVLGGRINFSVTPPGGYNDDKMSPEDISRYVSERQQADAQLEKKLKNTHV